MKCSITARMPFEDQVIWITGASSGIGEELTRQLASPRVRLLLTARNESGLNEVAAACRQQAAEVIICRLTLAMAKCVTG